jgi:hypothetical protein
MVDTNQPILDPRICSMFLLYFVNAFRSAITSNLGAYVVSGFEAHSLIPVIAIVGNVRLHDPVGSGWFDLKRDLHQHCHLLRS